MAEQVHQNVLILSELADQTRMVLEVLAAAGLRGTVVADLPSALAKAERPEWDLVLADLQVPGGGALELLRRVKADDPELPVVLLAGEGSVREVVQAAHEGCNDVLVKPVQSQALRALLEALLPARQVPLAASAQRDARCLCQIVGRSEKFLEVIRLARKVAPTAVPVLITGESGTGKELISYLVHHESCRSRGPYVRVNCAALSESLLESELFGHEKGAFTGAHCQRKGRFERAHGGTLLLDEISETSPRLQAELLRVLETQDFERVGGNESVQVNVRVVCTSNRDLAEEVARGRFRRDLYYRISGVRLDVPPLRQRKQDVPLLAWHFVNLYAREVRRRVTDIDPETLELLCQHPWPGNVRQLRNVIRAALILGEGERLSLDDAPALRAELLAGEKVPEASPLRLQELERQAIFEALRRTKSHQAKAARLLGITDRTLREKLRRYRQEEQALVAGDRTW